VTIRISLFILISFLPAKAGDRHPLPHQILASSATHTVHPRITLTRAAPGVGSSSASSASVLDCTAHSPAKRFRASLPGIVFSCHTSVLRTPPTLPARYRASALPIKASTIKCIVCVLSGLAVMTRGYPKTGTNSGLSQPAAGRFRPVWCQPCYPHGHWIPRPKTGAYGTLESQRGQKALCSVNRWSQRVGAITLLENPAKHLLVFRSPRC
jgi:hypothetical protein